MLQISLDRVSELNQLVMDYEKYIHQMGIAVFHAHHIKLQTLSTPCVVILFVVKTNNLQNQVVVQIVFLGSQLI